VTLRRTFFVLLTIAAGLLAAPTPPAWACSCAAIDHLSFADLAFVGVVTSVAADTGPRNKVAFAVESVEKGSAGAAVILTAGSSESSCGFRFIEGHRYRAFAKDGGTGLCHGNEDLGYVFRQVGERQAAAVAATPSPPAGWWPYGIGLIVLLAGSIFLVRRRRSR